MATEVGKETATAVAEEGDQQQQIIEEDAINSMNLTYDIFQVLKRHGVTKDQHLECYWIFLAGEYCASLMDDRNWTKPMIMDDIDKHRGMLENQIDIMISQAEKIKQFAEEHKDKILDKRRPTYVG